MEQKIKENLPYGVFPMGGCFSDTKEHNGLLYITTIV